MKNLSNIYRPITATPFLNDDTYCEIAPCECLRPYICCFWGTKKPVKAYSDNKEFGLVIPDTCMDIIFDIDYTQNTYSDTFCAIDEHSYKSSSSSNKNSNYTATFAIRFYAWTAILFAEQGFQDSKNQIFSVEEFFAKLKREIEPLLFEEPSLYGKIKFVEKILMKYLCVDRINSTLMNAVYYMINTHGRTKISDICSYASVSNKQLERIFNFNIGVSPKSFSSLIRYQMLWQEMVFKRDFKLLDSVEKYGYTDSSHLLKDFRNRHFMLPKEALKFVARQH